MKLKEASLPLSFNLEDTTNLVKELLKSRNWHEVEPAEIKLVLEPYFVFRYDAYFESSSEEAGKIVSETSSGNGAMNALTGELDEEVPELLGEQPELVQEIPDETKIEAKPSVFKEEEAKKISRIKIAQKLGTGKENVIISSFKLIRIPFWLVSLSLEEETLELMVSATDGTVLNEEEIPERGKGLWELTKETMGDLKKPHSWVKYPRDMMAGTAGMVSEKKERKPFKLSSRTLIAILIIIIIFLILWNQFLAKIVFPPNP